MAGMLGLMMGACLEMATHAGEPVSLDNLVLQDAKSTCQKPSVSPSPSPAVKLIKPVKAAKAKIHPKAKQ